MHRLTKAILRIWITVVSSIAFLVGWAALAHSPKPEPLVTQPIAVVQESLAPLAPLPTLKQLQTAGGALQSQSPATTFSFPRLRARGS